MHVFFRSAAVAAALLLSGCVAEPLAPGPGPTQPALIDGTHWQAHDGFVLAFSTWQAAQPHTVIVALHGMNDYGRFITDAATFWQSQGITTYAYDQRGFGRTEGNGRWPGHDVMAGDVGTFMTLVRARHPGIRIVLLGESMGGAVATLAAARGGTSLADGLILVSPAYWGWSNLDILKRAGLWAMMQLAPGARLTGRGLNIRPSDNEKMLLALGQDPFVIKATRVDATYGLVDLMEAAWQVVPEVGIPTLVLCADGDEVVPAAPIRQAALRMGVPARVVCYADGHHMLLRDLNAERTWRDVVSFVTTLPSSMR
jgi:alpha-beta hydrolase superfamily lysophospholipase